MVDPRGMDLLGWADSLQVDFPDDDIPILTEPNNWRTWGNDLTACQTFADNNPPDTNDYDDWFTWAQQVYYSMANYA